MAGPSEAAGAAGAAAGGRPLPAWMGKFEAVRELAARAALSGVDTEGVRAGETIATIGRTLTRLSNPQIELRDSSTIQGATTRLVFGKGDRLLGEPHHLSGMPQCFTKSSPEAYTPDFRVLELRDGYFCHYRDIPLAVSPQGDAVARDFSSRFAGLIHYYEMPLRQMLSDAVEIDGTVVVIDDDVRPLNYAHWIVDWLPRLAFLGERTRRPDMFVAVPPPKAAFQWETLRLCGFPPERVVPLDAMQGLRARRLLVPSDLTYIPHPAHKAAPWVLDYLRSALGYGAFIAGADGPPRRRKLYISRDDAAGRRVLNEPELIARLATLGYESVSLSGLSVAQQVATFACASHIVSAHGAGLANVVFADRSATLVEIFPATYGTAAYYVLAAGLGMTYASYVTDKVAAGSRAQVDDITVDIDDFLARCRHLL